MCACVWPFFYIDIDIQVVVYKYTFYLKFPAFM